MIELEENVYRFGVFEVDILRREISRAGEPVPLKSKAFDLLRVLLENRGRVVTKDELLESVWPDQFVEENNLTVQISLLRRVLGEKKDENSFIATVPGKGYQFVAKVSPVTGGEIIVEKHEFSRIILEETVELPAIDPGALITPTAQLQVSRSRRKNFRAIVFTAAAIGVLVLFSGAFVFRDRLFSNQAAAPFVQRTVRQLTTNGRVGNAALSPDGKVFAYTVIDFGNQALWLGYVDGAGDHLQLRESAEVSYRMLAFSPDASTIYFSAVDEKNPKGAIFRIPASGGVQTKLLDGVRDFSMSPDGRQVFFSKMDASADAHVFYGADFQEKDPREIGRLPAGYRHYAGSASMSPDGGRLAMGLTRPGSKAYDSVGILELASGKLSLIDPKEFREITKTSWLTDGRSLVVAGVEKNSYGSVPQYQLWNLDTATGGSQLLTPDLSNYGESWHNDSGVSLDISRANDRLLSIEHRHATNVWVAPSDDLAAAKQITSGSFGKYDGLWGLDWTPSGELIYTTSDTQSQYLATMEADGSKQKPITEPGNVDSQLTVSADGRHIVFHSNRTSPLDVWRTDLDGSSPTQLTFGGIGYQPAPSTDGRWVYFKSFHRGRGELCRVKTEGGEPECLSENEISYPTFSPDGNYFAAGMRTDKTRLTIFSAETNQVLKQFDLPKTGTLYMGFRWSPDSRSIAFRDKHRGYWMQPIDGGEARQIAGLPNEKLFNFAWSKDGSKFAFVRGQEIRDVVLFQTGVR